jgi:hypothetical protein
MRVPPVGPLLGRLIAEAAQAMGTTTQNLSYYFTDCYELVNGIPDGWTASNAGSGGQSVISDYATGVVGEITTANGADRSAVIGGRNGTISANQKLFCATRLILTGTSAAGAVDGVGFSSHGAPATLTEDGFYFAREHSRSATNWVVVKLAAGSPTTIDTGIAHSTNATIAKFWSNSAGVYGSVNDTPFSGNLTGFPSTANFWGFFRASINGGVAAARRCQTDWMFFAQPRT